MNTTTHELRKRFAVKTIIALLTCSQLASSIAFAQVSLPSDVIRRQSQYSTVQQAVYQLVAESKDVDNDGTLEVPAMKLGTGVGPGDGGVIPDTSGAPKTDGFGGTLAYCAWDNGTNTSSAGRIPGGSTAGSISLAVISYGLDNVFQTSCSDVASGITRGDDYAFWMTSNQLATASSSTTSTYWNAPVATQAILLTLPPATLHEGEVRLVKDGNILFRWDAMQQQWIRIGAGGSNNWSDSGSNDAVLANGKVAIGQASVGSEALVVNAASGTDALGLKGAGATTGVSIYNQAGSAVNAFLGYNNQTSQMVIDVKSGSFAIKTGGLERLSIAEDGSLIINSQLFLDANRNMFASTGTFTGSVNAALGYQVGGTTVIDAARNITNVTNISASGTASVGSLQLGGATAIDSNRAGYLSSLTTTGAITANGGILTTSLTASGKITTAAPTTSQAGLNLPHGVAPTAPINGDLWTTTGGMFVRINGSTLQLADTTSAQTLTNKMLGAGSTWNGNTIAVSYGGTGNTTVGTAGSVAYSTGTSYGFTAVGAVGQVLTSGGTASPVWTTATSGNTANTIVQRDALGNFSAGTITANLIGNVTGTATTATNLAAGSAGSIPYQFMPGATSMLAIGASGTVLTSNGTAPVWATPTGTGSPVLSAGPSFTGTVSVVDLTATGNSVFSGTIRVPTSVSGTACATEGQISTDASGVLLTCQTSAVSGGSCSTLGATAVQASGNSITYLVCQ